MKFSRVYNFIFLALVVVSCRQVVSDQISPVELEKYRNPNYLTTKPRHEDIVGDYEIASISKEMLHISEESIGRTVIRFNSDNSFSFVNFPFSFWQPSIENYILVNAKGFWQIDTNFKGFYVLTLTFTETQFSKSKFVEKTKIQFFDVFRLIGKQRPYELYVIHHPFYVGGTLLRKIKNSKAL